MMHCTNCGQANTETSQFCRFCGTKFFQQQQQQQQQPLPPEGYEYAPPRPYSWKTDEFQVADNKRPRQQQINQVQPLPNPYTTHQSARPQPLVHQQPQNMAYGYRCPRCASQAMPLLTRRISTAGWVVFAVLLFVFFPLFWIGLLIKEDARICPACNLKIN